MEEEQIDFSADARPEKRKKKEKEKDPNPRPKKKKIPPNDITNPAVEKMVLETPGWKDLAAARQAEAQKLKAGFPDLVGRQVTVQFKKDGTYVPEKGDIMAFSKSKSKFTVLFLDGECVTDIRYDEMVFI